MSTGQQLEFVEEHPGHWYAWLESMSEWNAGRDEDDGGDSEPGRGEGEMQRVLGPYASEQELSDAFDQQFANTGGGDIFTHDPAWTS